MNMLLHYKKNALSISKKWVDMVLWKQTTRVSSPKGGRGNMFQTTSYLQEGGGKHLIWKQTTFPFPSGEHENKPHNLVSKKCELALQLGIQIH